MFAMLIEDVFEIEGRGIVLSGHYDSERYRLCVNSCLYDMMGNEYVVSGFAMVRRIASAYADPKNHPLDVLIKDLKDHDKSFFVGKLLTTQYEFEMLYPENPLYPNLVDSVYRKESTTARSYALLNYELLTENEVRVKGLAQNGKIVRMMYRGWMIPPEQYEILYDHLAAMGVYLVNTPEQYKHCHCLPEWYNSLSDITPESVWTSDLSDKALQQALQNFGDSPVIVKDYVKSRKHEWYDACYIRSASDTDNALRIIHNFIERQGDSLTGGIVLRKFEPLVEVGYHPESGMPISEEYRVFFFSGQLMCVSEYWREAGQKKSTLSKEETAWIKSLPERIDSIFFTADIARKADGSLCVMELGDGQVSGLQGLNEDFFYRRLYDIYASITDICSFKELDGAIVAENTTEFKLPNGSITVTDSDGVIIPFSVERRESAPVYKYMDESGERLLKEFSTNDLYELYFELPPEKDKVYSILFSGGSLPGYDGDEYTFSISGVVGDYAVGIAAFDTESDLYHGLDFKEYEVWINENKTGYEVRPLLDKPVQARFYLAFVETGGFPKGAIDAVEFWVN